MDRRFSIRRKLSKTNLKKMKLLMTRTNTSEWTEIINTFLKINMDNPDFF